MNGIWPLFRTYSGCKWGVRLWIPRECSPRFEINPNPTPHDIIYRPFFGCKGVGVIYVKWLWTDFISRSLMVFGHAMLTPPLKSVSCSIFELHTLPPIHLCTNCRCLAFQDSIFVISTEHSRIINLSRASYCQNSNWLSGDSKDVTIKS